MTDIQKPNCATCPKEHTKKCPIDYEKSNGNSDIFDGMNRVTRNCLMGCHPNAREYLMQDVIEKLNQHPYQTIALQVVIDLLKGEVSKSIRGEP